MDNHALALQLSARKDKAAATAATPSAAAGPLSTGQKKKAKKAAAAAAAATHAAAPSIEEMTTKLVVRNVAFQATRKVRGAVCRAWQGSQGWPRDSPVHCGHRGLRQILVDL